MPSLKTKIPCCDIEHDLGVVVRTIFERGSVANGKLYPIVSELIEVNINLPWLMHSVRRSHLISKKVYILVNPLMQVTGIPARFDLVPREAFLKSISQYSGDLIALDLWEMFNAFNDIGFGAAGEPEALSNTQQVFSVTFRSSNIVARCTSQHLA